MRPKKKERASERKGPGPEKGPPGIWSGTVSFSLVAIPVRLVKAVEPGRVAFRLLHNKDYSPVKRALFCPEDGSAVPPGEVVRGWELAPGRHLLVTDEELESVSPERSRTIEIAEFIDLAEVDPLYYDHPYFLAPLKGGERSYRLLAEALRRSNKAGLAKFVLGEREYLVIVRSKDGALALNTLHYASELLPDGQYAPAKAADEKEKNAVRKHVREMTGAFEPGKYSDARRGKLLALLKKKAAGKRVQAPELEEEPAEGVADLVAALEESMSRMKGTR